MADPTQTDALGNAVTGARPATLAAIDDFVMGFLGYEPRAVNVLAAADADPDCCLAQGYAAWLWMFAEAEGAGANARPYADRARVALTRALGLARQPSVEATERAIDRALAARAPESPPFSIIAARLRNAGSITQAVGAARELHALERKLKR